MDIHLALDRAAPLRAQLEQELRAAIRAGRLRSGAKLPPSRVLADELDVSRGVVVEAYSQLVAEGYLVARSGDGTRIADGLAQQPPGAARRRRRHARRIRYDLRSGMPDLSLFPRRQWQSAMATVLRELPDAALPYGSRRGLRQLRVALSDYLGRVRAVVADPRADVHLRRRGARDGDPLAHARASVAPGGSRSRTRRGAAIPETVVQAGLEAVPIRVDEHGLDVAELEGIDVDAVVLSPAHQYPTGTVLAPERRAELIAWARRRGTLIVEDDYDAEYRYDREPIASLQGLAPDCVAYVGTASKTLAPGLRSGLGAGPEPPRRRDDGPARSGAGDAERVHAGRLREAARARRDRSAPAPHPPHVPRPPQRADRCAGAMAARGHASAARRRGCT